MPDLSWKFKNGVIQDQAATDLYRKESSPLTNILGEGIRYFDLMNYCQGMHLEFDLDGHIDKISIGYSNDNALPTLVISHSEEEHLLDLRTGIIQEKEHFSVFTHIAPLLPMAPELETVTKHIYTHG